jgi:hypothetical protein
MIVAYEVSPLCVYSPQSPTTCVLSATDTDSKEFKAQHVHGVLCVIPIVRSATTGALQYHPSAFTDAAQTLCAFNTNNLADDTPPVDASGMPQAPYQYGKVRFLPVRDYLVCAVSLRLWPPNLNATAAAGQRIQDDFPAQHSAGRLFSRAQRPSGSLRTEEKLRSSKSKNRARQSRTIL